MFENSAKKLEDILAEKIKKRIEEARRNTWNNLIEYVYDELESEARNMYDTFIEQYYEYETKSYYRHVAGVGTGWGDNLYYGKGLDGKPGSNGIYKVSDGEINGYKMNKFYTNFSADAMDGGYQHHSPQEVLNQVIGGVRGVPKTKKGKPGWSMKWRGSYVGKYFKYSGTLRNAFDSFDSDFDTIKLDVFNENKSKFIKKYFK